MPNTKHLWVRLIGSVTCSVTVLLFMIWQTSLEIPFFNGISNHFSITAHATEMLLIVICFERFTPLVPLTALIVGGWLLYKRPQALASIEVLIALIWLFTIIVVGFSFFGWEMMYHDLHWSELQFFKNPR